MNHPAGTATHPRDQDAFRFPRDFYATARDARWDAHAFELGWPGSALADVARDYGATNGLEALVTGALCILFARLTARPSVPLRIVRSSALELSTATSLVVRTGAAASAADVVSQIAERVDRRDTAHRDGASLRAGLDGGDGDTIEVVWVEAGPDRELDLAKIELDGLDDRGAFRLLLHRDERRLDAAFVYDAGRFKTTTVRRFAGHLGVLAQAIATEPGTAVSALPLLTEAERRFLDAVCEGEPAAPPTESVCARIERHAAASTASVAVRYGDQSLDYGTLNAKANRLAAFLSSKGIGADSRVVVCVEPGFDIVVALLAILKAGAVYVPLDPSYPPAYLRTILDDTEPVLVLTQGRFLPELDRHGVPAFGLDASNPAMEGFSDEDAARPVAAEQTAYVFYTSGTTGKPKGVMASYANLGSYVESVRDRYGMTSTDVVPALARFTFSISVFELLPVLSAGGTLVVLDRDQILDPARLADALRSVTLFHAGPSLMRLLIEHVEKTSPDGEAFSSVRHASSGGDMVPPDLLEAMKAAFPRAEVFVIYGCSEVSCMGCTYPVSRGTELTRSYVGRPFPGMSVRVLDDHLRRLPAGAIGEICFAGRGVVKGYLNRPELTAEKFVEVDGRRFYRTGDLGRISDDGWLEILGRVDFQAKVRGMRVELAEVEHHLRRAPGVKNGVATTKETPDGERVLVAYVVLETVSEATSGRHAVNAATIRRHMMEHLPDHMVPAMYLELSELPLNHNMKVDRRALPAPSAIARTAEGSEALREPVTPVEKSLAAIWQRLLGVDAVGLDDNFFELGGHSLLAVRLLAEVSTEMGVLLEGIDVLRETLEVLARSCDRRLGRAREAHPVRSARASRAPRVELLHFGGDRSLYGVLHHPMPAPCDEAVVVCGPLGHERLRSEFVLHLLARRLGQLGFPVLCFDYYGTGNSLGDGADATCERWRHDVVDARDELARRTGAARIVVVGVRLGATLAWANSDSLEVARWVLWDPVCSGSHYVSTMIDMHRRHLRATEPFTLRPRAKPPRGVTELLGTTYSATTLREIGRLSMAPVIGSPQRPIAWLAGGFPDRQLAAFERIRAAGIRCSFEAPAADGAWEDDSRLEDILPDVGVARTLAAMVTGGQ